MKLTAEQVKSEMVNEEYFLTIGKLTLSIGFIECPYGDHVADCMGHNHVCDTFDKQFHGKDALEKAVAYANRKINELK